MLFLSLLMSLFWMAGGSLDIGASSASRPVVFQHGHTVHGHLPAPGDSHYGTFSEHHGQHGHRVTFPGGGEHH